MSDPTGETFLLSLEESLRGHAIDASIFAPFVIARLRTAPEDTEAELQVCMKEESGREERTVQVRVGWNPQSAFQQPVAVQERVITEWAALGIACVVLPALAGVRITSVAVEGERFDYRVSDGVTEWGLEVSGTMTEHEGELRERLRLKMRQLHDNPYGLSGYVVVVAFVRREALVSLPDPVEEESE